MNLTRFDLFFPEKRPFFLENASTFQFGQPQSIDLFFSRRIGLSATGVADRHPRRRPAERQGRGLERRRAQHPDRRRRECPRHDDRAGQQLQRGPRAARSRPVELRRHLRQPAGHREARRRPRTGTGPTALDANIQVSQSQRLSAFFARTDTPGARSAATTPAARSTTSPTTSGRSPAATRRSGSDFNPEVGFLPRRGYRRPEFRAFFQPQPKNIDVDPPRLAARLVQRLLRLRRQAADRRMRTFTRSRFSRSRAGGSAGSWTTTRTTRSRRSWSTTATAAES